MEPLMQSNAPFPETFNAIREELRLSRREISRRCERHGWGSHTTISRLASGDLKPSMEALEVIARILGVPPETFAEYRMRMARRALDPDEVGFDVALKNLEHFTMGPLSGEPAEPHRRPLALHGRGDRGGQGASS
jgi:transcriptional regulator with XRE-family HTH domain